MDYIAGEVCLPIKQDREPFLCCECGNSYTPTQLRDQTQSALYKKFFRMRLDEDTASEVEDFIRPWYDKWIAGENICFDCGVENEASH